MDGKKTGDTENKTDVVSMDVDNDEMLNETLEVTAAPAQKKKTKKIIRRRKKIPRDVDAPKFPLTGYNRYTNEIRDEVRQKNPGASAIEITKILAEEWQKLTDEDKKPYLKAADIDKERYHREIGEYNKAAEAKKIAVAVAAETNALKDKDEFKITEKTAVGLSNGVVTKDTSTTKELKIGEIPIFTDDFLEHNRTIDSELKILRKSNADYEQQNAVLEKHVENMQNGIDKLETEMSSLKENNTVLSKYLSMLKNKLATALSSLALPGHPSGATIGNIDEYMNELQTMAASNAHPPATINKAKDIIRKIDLQIQL